MTIGCLVPELLCHKVLKGADINFLSFCLQCFWKDKSDQLGLFRDCVQAFMCLQLSHLLWSIALVPGNIKDQIIRSKPLTESRGLSLVL